MRPVTVPPVPPKWAIWDCEGCEEPREGTPHALLGFPTIPGAELPVCSAACAETVYDRARCCDRRQGSGCRIHDVTALRSNQ